VGRFIAYFEPKVDHSLVADHLLRRAERKVV